MSESINARQGIKTKIGLHGIALLSLELSESINARQGIKTECGIALIRDGVCQNPSMPVRALRHFHLADPNRSLRRGSESINARQGIKTKVIY